MKLVLKKSSFCLLLLALAAILLLPIQPANAQVDPSATPAEGYPPPATPTQPDSAYPAQPELPAATPTDESYVRPPTAVISTNPPAVVGENAPEATVSATLPISQSTLVRNRVILWAGFLITLLIFALAVYGAMLMYTRPRN